MIVTLTALAEPSRLRIMELLRLRPRPVGEIGARLQIRQPQVSKHLRILKDAGLVEVHPDAQRRLYQLRPNALRELDEWLEAYRRVWNARVEALEERRRATEEQPRRRRRRRK